MLIRTRVNTGLIKPRIINHLITRAVKKSRDSSDNTTVFNLYLLLSVYFPTILITTLTIQRPITFLENISEALPFDLALFNTHLNCCVTRELLNFALYSGRRRLAKMRPESFISFFFFFWDKQYKNCVLHQKQKTQSVLKHALDLEMMENIYTSQ